MNFCVGSGHRLHTLPSGTWYPRLPTLFGESMFSFIPRIWSMNDFMYIFWYLLVQILWRNRPEIQVFQVSATSFSWCKDRDESGVYPGWQCLGNVTFIIWAIFIFSNCKNHRKLSLNIQMFPKRVEKGQITATSIHQQSLLTSRICKHALCSKGGPSRGEPRPRKTWFWKHVQWGSGVAARPHISTVIWTAT